LTRWLQAPSTEDDVNDGKKTEIEQNLITELLSSAPNIILNVNQAIAPRWQLWLFAWIGIFAQLAVLVLGALTTYHWKFEKGGSPIALYGYPCTLSGTLIVSVGLLLCSHVIEGSTDECKLEIPKDKGHRILRIQRACVVSEQHFSSYALFNSESSNFLRTSRLNKKRDYSLLAALGSSFAIAGFIVQFVGLRALHWSATIMQLGATLFMTAIRSYARRGLAHDMDWERIPSGEELGWFSEHVCHTQGVELLSGSYVPYDSDEPPNRNQESTTARSMLFYSMPPKVSPRMSKVEKARLEDAAKDIAMTMPTIVQHWKKPTGSNPFSFRGRFAANVAEEMIERQSRLMEMSKWSQPQSEVAQRLVSAMMQIRDLFEVPENTLPKELSVSYKYNASRTTWDMPVILHGNCAHEQELSRPEMTNVSLNLPRIDPESDDKDPTKDLRLEIGSLLSLWLRTINKRSSIPEWKLDSPSALRRNEMMEIEMRVVPKNVFLRVVATEQSGDREEYRKLYLLGQWLEGPLFRVPCPVGMAPLSRSGGAFGFDTQQSSSLEHLLHHHPVFGLAFSSLLGSVVTSNLTIIITC